LFYPIVNNSSVIFVDVSFIGGWNQSTQRKIYNHWLWTSLLLNLLEHFQSPLEKSRQNLYHNTQIHELSFYQDRHFNKKWQG
jgi:hypothetical protein